MKKNLKRQRALGGRPGRRPPGSLPDEKGGRGDPAQRHDCARLQTRTFRLPAGRPQALPAGLPSLWLTPGNQRVNNASRMENRIVHLAIIMDGNGRWAQGRGLSRLKGHEAGTRAARNIVEAAKNRGISYLTLYAFSSENWKRPTEEVQGLFAILEGFIDREVGKLMENGVCLHTIGDLSKLPVMLQRKINETKEKTRGNGGIHLAVALNYGGRDELVRTVRKIVAAKAAPESITEESLPGFLDTSFMPDPDLLVRTGGEWRISNFLLWQLAYTEIFFTDTLWPDFDEKALDGAIAWFRSRQRRFGMTPEQIQGKDNP